MARVKTWPETTCNHTVSTDEQMSGIAGFVGRNQSLPRANMIQQMLGSMNHQDAYAPITLSFPQFRLELGWLSAGDNCVCVRDEASDLFILFRGEHFSDDERVEGSANLKENENYTATSLLALYKKLGADLFTKLNGYFSGVIVDGRGDNVVLFNAVAFFRTEPFFAAFRSCQLVRRGTGEEVVILRNVATSIRASGRVSLHFRPIIITNQCETYFQKSSNATCRVQLMSRCP